MGNLNDLLSELNATSSEADIKRVFEEIAEILLFNSHIETATGKYRILEIEFYFKNDNHKDNITIARTEYSGMWWLHEFGVDLTFNSNESKNFYGGILIRSMISLDENDGQHEKNKEIYGPRNCCWELFYSSALEQKQNYVPQIVVNDKNYDGTLEQTKRYITRKPKPEDGKYMNSPYRFYVKGLNLHVDSKYKKASPWK